MKEPITLPYPAEELRGRIVNFRILATRYNPHAEGIASGEGVLVLDGPDENGRCKAFIHHEYFDGISDGPGTLRVIEIYLDQRAADCLRVLDDGTLTCLDATLPEAC